MCVCVCVCVFMLMFLYSVSFFPLCVCDVVDCVYVCVCVLCSQGCRAFHHFSSFHTYCTLTHRVSHCLYTQEHTHTDTHTHTHTHQHTHVVCREMGCAR